MGPVKVKWKHLSLEIPGEVFLVILVRLAVMLLHS